MVFDVLHRQRVPIAGFNFLPRFLVAIIITSNSSCLWIDGQRKGVKLGMAIGAEDKHIIPIISPSMFAAQGF